MSCPYSTSLPDSVHLRKCGLRVGVCNERNWRYEYSLCQMFLDVELEIHKKKSEVDLGEGGIGWVKEQR